MECFSSSAQSQKGANNISKILQEFLPNSPLQVYFDQSSSISSRSFFIQQNRINDRLFYDLNFDAVQLQIVIILN